MNLLTCSLLRVPSITLLRRPFLPDHPLLPVLPPLFCFAFGLFLPFYHTVVPGPGLVLPPVRTLRQLPRRSCNLLPSDAIAVTWTPFQHHTTSLTHYHCWYPALPPFNACVLRFAYTLRFPFGSLQYYFPVQFIYYTPTTYAFFLPPFLLRFTVALWQRDVITVPFVTVELLHTVVVMPYPLLRFVILRRATPFTLPHLHCFVIHGHFTLDFPRNLPPPPTTDVFILPPGSAVDYRTRDYHLLYLPRCGGTEFTGSTAVPPPTTPRYHCTLLRVLTFVPYLTPFQRSFRLMVGGVLVY